MTLHFELAHDSWRTENARVFADELRQAPPLVRDRISKQFGLTLAFDAGGIRVDYDGRKVGFGSFSNNQGKTTFSISPKVDDLDVTALFNCIDALDLSNNIVRFENSQESSVHEEQTNPFSWAFLLGLLDEINQTGTTGIMATHDHRVVNAMRRRVIQLDRGVIVRDQERGVYE